MSALWITLLNAAFWLALHYGAGFAFSALPRSVQQRLFDCRRAYYIVSPSEKKLHSLIKIPYWKDKLPQFNLLFDKSKLGSVTADHIDDFIRETCKAEVVHLSIAVLGFLSLLFTFVTGDASDFWIFLTIAVIIGLCQIPFVLIQRYNRPRLLRLRDRLAAKA